MGTTLKSYPWLPGEPRAVDPKARQLRDVQRRFGLEAIKTEVLRLIGRYRSLLAHAPGRMSVKDAADRTARRLAEVEDERSRTQHIVGPESARHLLIMLDNAPSRRGAPRAPITTSRGAAFSNWASLVPCCGPRQVAGPDAAARLLTSTAQPGEGCCPQLLHRWG
jgi:hypothetical protein